MKAEILDEHRWLEQLTGRWSVSFAPLATARKNSSASSWSKLPPIEPDGSSAPVWTPERLFKLFPNLGEIPNRPGGRMSGGEQQMLTIARTLMGNPDAILLDEPSEGIAPVIVQMMADAIRAMKAEGVAVLLSEQNWAFAAGIGDRACVIERGEIRFQGSMAELVADEALRAETLGV